MEVVATGLYKRNIGSIVLTLVVVRKAAGCLIAVADTKLAPEGEREWTFTDQSNKIICYGKAWSICFSGNTAYAEEAAKRLSGRNDHTFATFRDILLDANRESVRRKSEADFLLFSSPSAVIHKFSEGRHTKLQHSAWIGDNHAFSKFQEIMHHPGGHHPLLGSPQDDPICVRVGASHLKGPEEDGHAEDILSRMRQALEGVIQCADLPYIGGFTTSLFIDARGRNFWPEIAVYANSKIPPSPERDKLFGTAEAGDYNYEIIVGPRRRVQFRCDLFSDHRKSHDFFATR